MFDVASKKINRILLKLSGEALLGQKPFGVDPDVLIYLAEEIQGKGVSKLLMQYVIDIAKENGSELLWLDCMDTKHQALKYYEKNGFKKWTLSFLDFELLIDKCRGIYLMCKALKAEV